MHSWLILCTLEGCRIFQPENEDVSSQHDAVQKQHHLGGQRKFQKVVEAAGQT